MIGDVIGFYGVPAAVASIMVFFGLSLAVDHVNILIIAHTILIPLLMNVLFLIFNIVDRGNVAKNPKRRRLLDQLYDNVAYLIVVAVFSMGVLAICTVNRVPSLVKLIDHWLVYFVIAHIFLTALMIVKRIHVLLSTELEHISE